MKLILTNDDGIDAPGLEALRRAVADLGTVILVAPEVEQSGVGHQVTDSAPIRVDEADPVRVTVAGTPVDCARVALRRIAPDAGWLISGINRGANLGIDTFTSGTVAAAREAAALGCRAMAISQYVAKGAEVDWEVTRHHAAWVIRTLMETDLAPGSFWNVNLPHPQTLEDQPNLCFRDLDPSPHRFTYRREGDVLIYEGDFHGRPRLSGRDIDCCMSGMVSVTRMSIGTAESRCP